ncbi:hypothetical protein ACHAQA_008007 [Verticillium albo-atrum]
MKGLLFFGGGIPLLAYTVEGATAIQKDGILGFPLRASVPRAVDKRQLNVGVKGQITDTLYTIDIVLGTPGQTVSVQLDTAQDETWVNPVCAKSYDPAFCVSQSRFTFSSTLVDLGVQGAKQAPIGYVEWEYVYDHVTLGGARIPQQIFGAAYDSEHFVAGVLGVAPSLSGWDSSYPYVLDSLYYEGFINSRAFSLDLRDIDSNDGSVIFGGLDTSRYVGSLEKLPIVPAASSPDGFTRYWVNVDGISVVRQGNGEAAVIASAPQAFNINSGSTFSGFPTSIFNGLLASFPEATPIPGSTYYAIDCTLAGEDTTIRFKFGGITIEVPIKDFIVRQADTCYLGAYQEDSIPTLGATFLRAAYVVFDWDNLYGSAPTTGPSYATITRSPYKSTTVTFVTTYTITSCHDDVLYCRIGQVTTELATRYTTVCPETTATYTLPNTYSFVHTAPYHTQEALPYVVTVAPAPTLSTPVEVPGCNDTVEKTSPSAHKTHTSPSEVNGEQPAHETNVSPVAPYTQVPGNVSGTKSSHGSAEEAAATTAPKNDYPPVFTTLATNNTAHYPTSTISADVPVVTAGASVNSLPGLIGLGIGLVTFML